MGKLYFILVVLGLQLAVTPVAEAGSGGHRHRHFGSKHEIEHDVIRLGAHIFEYIIHDKHGKHQAYIYRDDHGCRVAYCKHRGSRHGHRHYRQHRQHYRRICRY